MPSLGEPRMTVQTLAILRVLLSDLGRGWYGAEIGKAAELKSGTLYPSLARLERAGWLTSELEEGDPAELGRPLRRTYYLTGNAMPVARRALRTAQAQIGDREFAAGWMPDPGEVPA